MAYTFFLGGHDLEMVTIRDLLAREMPDRFHDKGLAWGARASAYREEIAEALERGETPVLVELAEDLGLPAGKVVMVDHHGERAGKDRPTSLHQVFALLRLPSERWSRWYELVAANDRGYIPALLEVGATPEEIAAVRTADRAAQGITEQEEIQGEEALAGAETLADGRLTIARLPHTHTAVVTDRLEPVLGGPGYVNLLVVSPGQLNFFGEGQLVERLRKKFGGWYGGGLPERGFWGHGEPLPDVMPILLGQASQEKPAKEPADPTREPKGERMVESRCPECGGVVRSSQGSAYGFVFSCLRCGASWRSR